MLARGINRRSAESIQTVEDMRDWARDHEALMDSEVEQLHDEIIELRDVDDKQQKAIFRNLNLLRNAAIVFGSAFAVVIALFGIILISGRFF